MPLSQQFLSPSLRRDQRSVPAFELKFRLPSPLARAVEDWLKGRMDLDPHCQAALGNAYRVSTVYSDTLDLAVFHKAPGHTNRKFRLRRYDSQAAIFLERKTKWGDRLVKRRTLARPVDLECLQAINSERDWAAYWFHRNLCARQLRPVCHIGYLRTAYIGVSEQGATRLTIDRDLVCTPHEDWVAPPSSVGRALLGDEAVLELKFSTMLPVLFRRLVYELGLAPNTVSKYRRAVQVCGLDAIPREQPRCRIG